jgi:soluble lytic murein transglycosylase-like protein
MKLLYTPLVLLLIGLFASVPSAFAQKKTRHITPQPKSTQDSTDSIEGFRKAYIEASEKYKDSLQKLISLQENDARTRAEQASKLKELYDDGLISRVEYEASTAEISGAQAKVDELKKELATVEMTIAEARSGPRAKDFPNQMVFSQVAWTTGNARIDSLIRQNGARYGVDPYLIYCVMHQESRFNTSAVSVKGAQGLMQLMPGTAARYGVRNSNDPAQNIMGGTRYLKDLLKLFNGRIDLVLAGYNAGEGAVMKYGHNVPPYKETRDYVRLISKRYGQQQKPKPAPKKATKEVTKEPGKEAAGIGQVQ